MVSSGINTCGRQDTWTVVYHCRQKCELPKPNKRFLSNMVMGAMSSNRKKMRTELHGPEKRKHLISGSRKQHGSEKMTNGSRKQLISASGSSRTQREDVMKKPTTKQRL